MSLVVKFALSTFFFAWAMAYVETPTSLFSCRLDGPSMPAIMKETTRSPPGPSIAMSGVAFKLSAKGTKNNHDIMTLLGPEEVIRRVYAEFYGYTLRAFPALVSMLPMCLDIHESSIGA